MTTRTLYGIVFDVDSPSLYRARSRPSLSIQFEGLCWFLSDSADEWGEEHPSLDTAARRLRELVDRALARGRKQATENRR